ncbi:CobD/CbiB family protein [Aquabacterium fontiphilum]|jgi:adenosylcobinamide-phosphate synthase|uniref:CobD/CbiB family protein n=1 Tax=Aquabacterium fontiphilum TaxID=450365 RepID=UPI001377D05D|nr:CobD/CbiB family protein [Aquabacterium fontiphilum]NBD19648.1 CobD/CbiB family protein [Aquabacterium fontiphilum]
MSFFAVLFALLAEQLKPLSNLNPIHHGLVGWVRWAGRNFDAGDEVHAKVVWGVTVVAPAVLVALVYVLIDRYSTVLALLFDVAILYFTLGFRQFSHHFTAIRDALEQGREDRARELLAHWQNLDASELPRTEILRHVLEYSLLAAHRHVFGVFFWFVALSTVGLGPAGAVLYRMAEFASRYWSYKSQVTGTPTHDRLMGLSQTLFSWLDHVPARLTAFGFAVVGNFEDAVDAWRRHAVLWVRANEGTILSAASGALGVRLGGQVAPSVAEQARDVSRTMTQGDTPDVIQAQGSTFGADPQPAHLRSVVGLIWRSVVLWMLLLALLSLANLIG